MNIKKIEKIKDKHIYVCLMIHEFLNYLKFDEINIKFVDNYDYVYSEIDNVSLFVTVYNDEMEISYLTIKDEVLDALYLYIEDPDLYIENSDLYIENSDLYIKNSSANTKSENISTISLSIMTMDFHMN